MQRRCGTFADSYHRRESCTHQRQNGGRALGVRATSLLGGGCGDSRAEVEGGSSSHVAAHGLDGRRGYIVQGAVASFLGRGDAVAVNIFEAGGSVAKRG